MTAQSSSPLTLLYTTHRPEMVAPAAAIMARHTVLVLEEPPHPGFEAMLGGDLAVADYLLEVDQEYPEFSRQSCRVWRRLHRAGHRILQVEPFLEHLLGLHARFADGDAPADIRPGTLAHAVYLAEHEATRTLLAFYRASVGGSFERIVAAVKAFARKDAARLRLRDRLRANRLAPLLTTRESVCIEAGEIHRTLFVDLHALLGKGDRDRLRRIHLPRRLAADLGLRGRVLSPGDRLTLRYLFGCGRSDGLEDRLAARALIYNKLIRKVEDSSVGDDFPHLRDEVTVIGWVDRLPWERCRSLFDRWRGVSTGSVRDEMERWLRTPGRIGEATGR